ncbi:MAG: fumarylacetoacetate hydrolase family protein [Verrucomicrobia bacterium]|nr:fumarylacetoacetate hydrolase family protein [Verrucomicrobiota bacterium]MCH8510261.1 fumarylacetoacetate hydrolase family protein [Kiritimatiellia bacterium]
MRIARVTLASNQITYVQQRGEEWVRCEGSLTEGWTATDEIVTPARFLPPLNPRVVYAIGVNYREHAIEMRADIPDHPVVTMKNPASVIGHEDVVLLPRFLPSDSVDYEVELAIVIGKACKNISKEDALNYVAGFTIANDVSARDWQKIHSGGQWVRGKSFDTFCPLGPVLVTPDELVNPDNLEVSFELNGEVMQSSNTSDMIFSVAELITFLSGSATLLPGTVILTGTPPGVGAARTPPRYLQPGDRMVTTIAGIGSLVNTVQEETLSTTDT